MTMWRIILALALLFPATALAAQTSERQSRVLEAVGAATAEEAIELATKEVLGLIDSADYAQNDEERFYTAVESLLRPMIDFPRFARGVMGPYAKRATPEQRERFAESFKWSLVKTYALALTEFKGGEVAVKPPRRKAKDPDKADVAMVVRHEGKDYSVIYRMQRKSGTWKLFNLVIEGVNIGINYRTQFAQAMKDPRFSGDLDVVIDAWTDVIDEEEQAQPAEAGGV
jgi:phospholipid transport system substrate-binding protein